MDVILDKKSTRSKSKMIIITLAVIFSVLLVISFQVLFFSLNSEKVYKGVFVDGINAGGLLPEDLKEQLSTNYLTKTRNVKLTIIADEYKEKYSLEDLGYSYDFEATVAEAYSIGREGNLLDRLSEIMETRFNKVQVNSKFDYDAALIEDIIYHFSKLTYKPLENPGFIISDGIAQINSGHNGEVLDTEHLNEGIVDFLNTRKNSTINAQIDIVQKDILNSDLLFDKISSQPINATTKLENGQIKIITHKTGIKIDKNLLEDAVKVLQNSENKSKKIDISFIVPEITEDKLRNSLLKDVLASFTTRFSTSGQLNIDRTENLRLCVEKINGKVLLPQDIFSFNETVGSRTIENGFKNAQIFVGGKIVEGLGGGICQVSSTLYNTALKANLNIIERVNHMFTVPYVSAGLDATVAYGSIDFRFRNSTNWPLKIESYLTQDNQLVFIFKGTKENTDQSVELFPQIIKTMPFPTVYIDDDTLPMGEMVIKQNGLNGYVVDTYKVVKNNGVEISNTKITTSTYTPLEKLVSRGTKNVGLEQEQGQAIDKNQPDKEDFIPTISDEANVEIIEEVDNIDDIGDSNNADADAADNVDVDDVDKNVLNVDMDDADINSDSTE